MSGDRKPTVFLNTKHDESAAAFSPDGGWIAYQSNASGGLEVYVRPFPAREPFFKISRNGGGSPRWSGDGKELFFLSPDGSMMAARFDPTTGLAAGVPERLFPTQQRPGANRRSAVARDGRFLIRIAAQHPLQRRLVWAGLRRT